MSTAFIQSLGPLELAIILLIVLVIVGGRRLPELGRQLGGGMREFKDSVTGKAEKHFDDDSAPAEPPPALGRPSAEAEPVEGEVMRERT